MRKSNWTPSIVPRGDDQNIYLVVDDRQGRVWREADIEAASLETVILNLLEGQFKNPVRVVAYNTATGGFSAVQTTARIHRAQSKPPCWRQGQFN
jgi:hypothetical protein